jgi:hypothetical protein
MIDWTKAYQETPTTQGALKWVQPFFYFSIINGARGAYLCRQLDTQNNQITKARHLHIVSELEKR